MFGDKCTIFGENNMPALKPIANDRSYLQGSIYLFQIHSIDSYQASLRI